MTLVFLTEEKSMQIVLETILPRILPDDVAYQIIPHRGKSDLRTSIPMKLQGWNMPDSRFVIVHDQDANDCILLKKELKDVCDKYNRTYLIRIVCHELESWYFGDLEAVSEAYGKDLTPLKDKRKYRVPDDIANPKEELKKLVPNHHQLAGARKIASYMDVDRNTSKSFQVFVEGVRRICEMDDSTHKGGK